MDVVVDQDDYHDVMVGLTIGPNIRSSTMTTTSPSGSENNTQTCEGATASPSPELPDDLVRIILEHLFYIDSDERQPSRSQLVRLSRHVHQWYISISSTLRLIMNSV